MKKNHMNIVKILLIIIILTGIVILIQPTIYEYVCKNKIHENIHQKIDEKILNSILIVVSEKTEDNITSYSQTASGFIFDKEDTTYYAITAYHAISGKSKNSWLIQTYNLPSRIQYEKELGRFVSNSEYYDLLPKAKIEYLSKEYDLAVISFKSEEKLNTLNIAESNPVYGEQILLLGAPEGEKIAQYYGEIKSKKHFKFIADDGTITNMTIKHNAFSAPGSSGGAILNEKLDVVGVTIGGGKDSLGRFKFGVMIPSVQIHQFIEKWKSEKH